LATISDRVTQGPTTKMPRCLTVGGLGWTSKGTSFFPDSTMVHQVPPRYPAGTRISQNHLLRGMELPGEPWKRKEKNKMPSSCQGDKGEDKEVSYFKCIKTANCRGYSKGTSFFPDSTMVHQVPPRYPAGTRISQNHLISNVSKLQIANCKLHRFLRAFQGSSKKMVLGNSGLSLIVANNFLFGAMRGQFVYGK
jgi:hypothetical protein